jgi:dihydroxyacetone kinase-like predicted kinase
MMPRNDDKIQGTFITEIEISKGLLVRIFTKFLDRISPRKEEVNDMNYFPVRDCDTGDNLVVTLKSILRGIRQTDRCTKRELIESLEEEILLGAARGNAGMIFTGWFAGLLNYLAEELVLNSQNLAHAMQRGRDWGHKVFAEPREGTILDPIARSAQTALTLYETEKNLVSLFEGIISQARIAVDETTDKLDDLLKGKNTPEEIQVLQANHVVDAGALGFLIFLEGLQEAIAEAIEERAGVVVVIKGEEDLNEDVLREAFSPLGDSLDINVSPSRKKVAIHIHTDFPQKVAEVAAGFSRICDFRIEDLTEEG